MGAGGESQMEWLPGDRYTAPPPPPNRQVWEFLFGKDLEQAFLRPFSKPREGSCSTSMGYGILIPAHARRRPGRRAARCPVSQQRSLGSHVPRALDPATQS